MAFFFSLWFFFLQEKKQKADEGQSSEDASDAKEEAKEEKEIVLRPLNMEDMRQAKNQVTTSESHFSSWNAMHKTSGFHRRGHASNIFNLVAGCF